MSEIEIYCGVCNYPMTAKAVDKSVVQRFHDLTLENIKFRYDLDGFVVVKNLFADYELDPVLEIFRKRADEKFSGIMNLDREVKEVFEMVTDKRMKEILETLQSAPVSLLQTMFLFKEVGSPYAAQAWSPHQDNAYPMARIEAYLTGNICFSDQDPNNGGMYIYPGSHEEGLLPFRAAESFHETPGTSPGNVVRVPTAYERIDLRMKKGDVLFLHGCVIHGSYPNASKIRSRPMLLIPYITAGESFIPGEKAKRKEVLL